MESISLLEAIRKIKDANLRLVTVDSLGNALNILNRNTIHKILQRLLAKQLIFRLGKGKYALSDPPPTEFEIVNLLQAHAYISFETALSHYGILSQFTYVITCATAAKTTVVTLNSHTYEFSHLDHKLFWGYQKQDGYLIALPEKAIIDSLYLTAKKTRFLDFGELDLSTVDKKKLKDFASRVEFRPFQNLLSTLPL